MTPSRWCIPRDSTPSSVELAEAAWKGMNAVVLYLNLICESILGSGDTRRLREHITMVHLHTEKYQCPFTNTPTSDIRIKTRQMTSFWALGTLNHYESGR